MRLDDLPESGNVEDRRGEGGFGGGGFGLPIGGGGLSIGAIVALGLIGWALGIDPSLLIGGAEILTGPSQPQVQAPPTARRTSTPQDDMGRFVSKVLGSTELQWKQVFAKDGKTYRPPVLVLYRGATHASCGGAVGSRPCQFSQAYVIAHEVGHHVQNLLGILPKAQQAQRAADSKAAANHIQVQVELQADCLAGVWANRENEMLKSEGKPPFIEPGDVEAALRTAAAIGDDTLQRRARGYVVPDSFTHGSSEQRQRWFNTGFRSGSVASCNTFAPAQPG